MGIEFEAKAVEKFREYIRIKTMQPNPDYASAVVFFRKYAQELGLEFKSVEAVQGKPVILISLKGTDESASSILLNSHMDVVPVFEEHWTHPPFSAFMSDNGDIYGRGTQDMKSVTIQYLEALRCLKTQGFVPRRNIHVSIVPDEEVGGKDGMKAFLDREEFKQLNVGFSMDEGLASETDVFKVYNAERKSCWVEITCRGTPGHGSLLIENTAAEKMRRVIEVFMGYRDECIRKAEESQLKVGSRRTLNLTVVHGGVQVNVVPAEFKMEFDIRVLPDDDGQSLVEELVEEAGVDVEIRYLHDTTCKVLITDQSNPFCASVWKVFRDLGLKYEMETFVGGTDARFLRALDIPALGFSPMSNTKVLLHDHDEKLNRQVFVAGLRVYEHLIKALAMS